jgi:hypothetical protein
MRAAQHTPLRRQWMLELALLDRDLEAAEQHELLELLGARRSMRFDGPRSRPEYPHAHGLRAAA